jgi:hypothetical protein
MKASGNITPIPTAIETRFATSEILKARRHFNSSVISRLIKVFLLRYKIIFASRRTIRASANNIAIIIIASAGPPIETFETNTRNRISNPCVISVIKNQTENVRIRLKPYLPSQRHTTRASAARAIPSVGEPGPIGTGLAKTGLVTNKRKNKAVENNFISLILFPAINASLLI